MSAGLLMLILPAVVYLISIPASNRLKRSLCWLYRILGGIIVLAGSAFSLYLAAYSGDQGGIAAYFFQIAVIVVYAIFSVMLLALNWFMNKR
ncbi:MAG: hypothetical protein QNJ69_11365 [Gammaproteobacteria bacterium]|nr:hypothetical protein [Gammaproteobacteria bacterium]